MYQARILDKDRTLKAILPGVRWHYTRRINEATAIEVYIPKETIDEHITPDHTLYGFFAPTQPFVVQGKPTRAKPNKAQYAEIASYVQIYKGGKLKASGKIVGRTLGQVVTVQAYTEEILLESNLTPAQYGKVWDGWDLADVARDLLDGWQAIRVKDKSQWELYMVDNANIDLTTDPGHVMLAKQANGRYHSSGYITLMFESSDVQEFKAWDRVRWSADSEDPVKTSIQVSTDGVSWSQEYDGGLPEEIGYYIGGTHDKVYVRINLSTADTESEDPEGNPVGVTPVVFALEVIARAERGEIAPGNIPDMAGVTVKGIDADHANAFQVLASACEQVGWEFAVWNGALSIAVSLGVDRTKDFILRAGTNTEITALGDDDEELVNVLTAYGPGSGLNRLETTLRDEASISMFGEYPVAMEFDIKDLQELQTKAQAYLEEHNSPKTRFEVSVAFEAGQEPEYGIGDKVRVADPETGIVTTARIMSESREYSGGLRVRLELGKAGLSLLGAIEGDHKPKKPLEPLVPTGVYAKGIIKGIIVSCSAPKTDWAYTECHVSTAKGFVPGSATLVDKGKQTRFDVPNLEPGVRYYARLIHVDSSGRRSEPSREVSAAAQYIPVEALPDYSIGIEKFMENVKPPVMVSSLPALPDPRYTVGTTVFLITDKKLYSTDGNTWTPVGAGTVTADEIMAGIITAGGVTADYIKGGTITADKYAEIRNSKAYPGLDSLDASNPVVVPFYIPEETTNIVAVFLAAEARRYRAYAKSAPYEVSMWYDKTTGQVDALLSPTVSISLSTTTIENNDTSSVSLSHHHKYEDKAISNISSGTFSLSKSDILYDDYDRRKTTDPVDVWGGSVDDHKHEYAKIYISSKGSHTHSFSTSDTTRNTTTPYNTYSTDLSHSHKFSYVRVSSATLNNFESHKHEYDPSHEHPLEFGIYQGTTPANVKLRVNNGIGWSDYITLASAPDTTTPYDLIENALVDKYNSHTKEMDLTDYIIGYGWKYLEFSSSRLGRIAWNLEIKVDVTA